MTDAFTHATPSYQRAKALGNRDRRIPLAIQRPPVLYAHRHFARLALEAVAIIGGIGLVCAACGWPL